MSKRLGISPTVFGRRNNGQRVQYLLAPDGTGDKYGVPEAVVLHRWRKRKKEGFTFSGARLSPTFWRALPQALGPAIDSWHKLDETEIAARVKRWTESRRTDSTEIESGKKRSIPKLPSGNVVHAIIHTCKPAVLRAFVDRHAQLAKVNASGVPDLFLFARDTSNRVRMARFVEVKKHGEPVSADQTAEHTVMYDHQLPVRTFVLKERERGYDAPERTQHGSPAHEE